MNTFRGYGRINLARAMRWHRGGLDEWSVTDWATALAGEVGELCNAVKKFRRVEDRLQGHDGDTPQPADVAAAVKAIKKEVGDVFAYLDLLAQRFDLDTWECVRDTFNQISEREQMPERMPSDFDDEFLKRLTLIRDAVELISTDRDFVVHSNRVTEEALERIKRAANV